MMKFNCDNWLGWTMGLEYGRCGRLARWEEQLASKLKVFLRTHFPYFFILSLLFWNFTSNEIKGRVFKSSIYLC